MIGENAYLLAGKILTVKGHKDSEALNNLESELANLGFEIEGSQYLKAVRLKSHNGKPLVGDYVAISTYGYDWNHVCYGQVICRDGPSGIGEPKLEDITETLEETRSIIPDANLLLIRQVRQ